MINLSIIRSSINFKQILMIKELEKWKKLLIRRCFMKKRFIIGQIILNSLIWWRRRLGHMIQHTLLLLLVRLLGKNISQKIWVALLKIVEGGLLKNICILRKPDLAILLKLMIFKVRRCLIVPNCFILMPSLGSQDYHPVKDLNNFDLIKAYMLKEVAYLLQN